MKIIFVSPTSVVFDQTPHYYQASFSATAQYLRDRFADAEVVIESSGFHGSAERNVIRHFVGRSQPEFLIFWSRPWEAKNARDLAVTVRKMAKKTGIFVWGDACNFIPHYFEREPFDLVVRGGDPEQVLGDAIQAWKDGRAPEHGVSYRDGCSWKETATGKTLAPEEWPFPAEDALDPTVYQVTRVQRGLSTDDLSFTVSRGCPINCAKWCPTPRKEGLIDRRRPVRATVEYMQRGADPFEMFQMHSPLFSQNRQWIDEFIALKGELCPEASFKVVDLMNPYADEDLVARLAGVGLKNVGFGVETLAADTHRALIPKVDVNLLGKVAANFKRYKISSKAYIQLGLPGQKREDILYTLGYLRDLGFKVRPTGSTPFWRLARMSVEELDATDLSCWDRKSYYEPRSGLSYREFYQLITAPTSFEPDEEVSAWAA
ncbi:MAG: radical SAM protein [Vulcanimicrobiota bacterium]